MLTAKLPLEGNEHSTNLISFSIRVETTLVVQYRKASLLKVVVKGKA